MPTYEYQCDSCQYKWEEYRLIDERDIPIENPCPECNDNKVSRCVASAGIHSGRGLGKVDNGFKDIIKQIKKNNPGNCIQERW